MQAVQGLGHVALFQSRRDDEDFIVRKEVRFFEREFQFLMAVSMLFIEVVCEADDDRIAFEDRITDLVLPILPGLESFRIKPDIQSILDQTLIQFVDGFPVAVCVDEEDARLLC